MESRANSVDEDIRQAEALLAQIGGKIRQTDFDINSEMDHRDNSYEAALRMSAEEEAQIRQLMKDDETFHIMYLPDEDTPSSKKLRKLKNASGSSSPHRRAPNVSSANNNKNLDDDDFDDGGDDDDDYDEGEDEEEGDDGNDTQQHLVEKQVKDPFNGDYADGKIPDASLDNFWVVEAVLARKTVKGRLFYRVKWRNANLVTWELNTKIENRAAVNAFEAQRYAASHFECVNKAKLRPVVYISAKRLERIAKKDAEAARKITEAMTTAQQQQQQQTQMQETIRSLEGVAGTDVIWSCEVEPFIWMPYDVNSQQQMEAAHRLRQPSCQIHVSGMTFDINLSQMRQTRNGGGSRKIQRVAVQNHSNNRNNNSSSRSGNNNNNNNNNSNIPNFDEMNVQQLRDFVARMQNLQDPIAFEALSRLESMDKAVPAGVGKNVVANFPKSTFEEIMAQICNGVEYPAFTTECHICLEDYVGDSSLTSLPHCGHLFHTHCIEDFLGKYSKVCPICRERVV